MQLKAHVALATLVILAGSGCSGGGTYGFHCQAVGGTAALAWPAPGATGVDPSIGVIFLGPQAAVLSVTLNAGSTAIAGTLNGATPSPLPSGAPTGGPNATGDLSVTIPKLASATTYSVVADVSPGCGGGSGVMQLGSFTTK